MICKYNKEDFNNQINHLKRAVSSINLVTKWLEGMPRSSDAQKALVVHNNETVKGLEEEISILQDVVR